jgi:ribonuclease G
VEPTAACVAIDVDGEGRAALEVDIDAAFEIARLVRLRNLGGTIIVDFVDLPVRAQQQRLEAAIKKAFRDDPLPADVFPMSPLGVVQISRARRGRSLDALLARQCPCCDGAGHVPSLRAAAEGMIAELRRAAVPHQAVRLAPDLAAYLDGPAAVAWRSRKDRLNVTVDAGLAAGGYVLE